MGFTLYFVAGRSAGKRVVIDEGHILTLGRSTTNDVIVRDGKISRIHCQLEVSNGICTISDLNSTNGTFVNNERITEKSLQPGDTVKIGNCVLKFEATETTKAEKKRLSSTTFEIGNGGDGTLYWNARAEDSWVTLSPTSGTTGVGGDPATVTLSVDTTALTEEEHVHKRIIETLMQLIAISKRKQR